MHKIRQIGISLLAIFTAITSAQAAIFMTDIPVVGSNYNLDITVENNDMGAVYNSATTNVFQTVAQDIFDLGNHSFSTVDEMVNAEFSPSINPATTTVDNFNGWSTTSQNNGEVSLTNNGLVKFGTPAYTIWDTDADSSYMSLTAPVSTSLLETNATAGHQAFTLADVTSASWNSANFDAIIVRSDNDMLNLANYTGSVAYNQMATFTGVQDIDNSWSDNAPGYAVLKSSDFSVVPEPSQFALALGCLALIAGLSRRNR